LISIKTILNIFLKKIHFLKFLDKNDFLSIFHLLNFPAIAEKLPIIRKQKKNRKKDKIGSNLEKNSIK